MTWQLVAGKILPITKSLKKFSKIWCRHLRTRGPSVATSLFPGLKQISVFDLTEQTHVTLKDFSPPAEFCPAEQL